MDIATATAAAPAEGRRALSDLSADFEAFLQLLTAQVAHQDPLEPMDSSTFVTQLAQLSQVEQGVQTNERLADLSAQVVRAAGLADAALVGREVEVVTPALSADGAPQPFDVRFARAVERAEVRLIDESGVVRRSFDLGATEAGSWASVRWDGRDASDRVVGEGTLRIEVAGIAADGGAVPGESRARVAVEGIVLAPDGTHLRLRTGRTVERDMVSTIY